MAPSVIAFVLLVGTIGMGITWIARQEEENFEQLQQEEPSSVQSLLS